MNTVYVGQMNGVAYTGLWNIPTSLYISLYYRPKDDSIERICYYMKGFVVFTKILFLYSIFFRT